MRGNIWHLNPVNIIIPFYHVVKPMLPMHCHQGKPLFIRKQKSCVSVVRGKVILQSQGKEFFTWHGKDFFT